MNATDKCEDQVQIFHIYSNQTVFDETQLLHLA